MQNGLCSHNELITKKPYQTCNKYAKSTYLLVKGKKKKKKETIMELMMHLLKNGYLKQIFPTL